MQESPTSMIKGHFESLYQLSLHQLLHQPSTCVVTYQVKEASVLFLHLFYLSSTVSQFRHWSSFVLFVLHSSSRPSLFILCVPGWLTNSVPFFITLFSILWPGHGSESNYQRNFCCVSCVYMTEGCGRGLCCKSVSPPAPQLPLLVIIVRLRNPGCIRIIQA